MIIKFFLHTSNGVGLIDPLNTSMYAVFWLFLLDRKKSFAHGCAYAAIAWMRKSSELARKAKPMIKSIKESKSNHVPYLTTNIFLLTKLNMM